MPVLTVAVDLPETAYQNAVILSPAEQNRVATIALTAVFAANETAAVRYADDADETAAFYAGLTEAEKAERRRTVEAGSVAGDAGRVLSGETLFARVRARHSGDTETK